MSLLPEHLDRVLIEGAHTSLDTGVYVKWGIGVNELGEKSPSPIILLWRPEGEGDDFLRFRQGLLSIYEGRAFTHFALSLEAARSLHAQLGRVLGRAQEDCVSLAV